MDYADILSNAHKAAGAAVAAEVLRKPEDMNAFDCGFAWVTIDGKHPLANYARKTLKAAKAAGPGHYHERFLGSKGYPTGWQWWKPGNFNGQSIRIHEVGARAFRDYLATHNIVATVGSRLD